MFCRDFLTGAVAYERLMAILSVAHDLDRIELVVDHFLCSKGDPKT